MVSYARVCIIQCGGGWKTVGWFGRLVGWLVVSGLARPVLI
jgi:hypothetical protein